MTQKDGKDRGPERDTKNRKGEFRITEAKGFHIQFENGVVVSVQFGYGNYCANRDNLKYANENRTLVNKQGERFYQDTYSPNAEVAIWDSLDSGYKWITKECPYISNKDDDVEGWITPDEIPEILTWAKNYRRLD